MNVKKKVFEYLGKYPEATTLELMTAFPNATKKSLWNYSGQWKKNQGIRPAEGSNSIRQRVFSYIDSNPEATSKDLQKAFPNENRVSISNYHYQWRKIRPDRKKKKSVKNTVFAYLNRNPHATYRELRNALPGINPSSISAYQSIWKQTQTKEDLPPVSKQTKQGKKIIPPLIKSANTPMPSAALEANVLGNSTQELIETLKTTIKTQKTTIEIIKEQNALLRRNQSGVLAELDEVSDGEWQELQKIMTIFIRGLKNS
ncbi:MAG: hypothetical protein HN580_27405 [Deltaproteobacteria bacterium]|jgi:hypothetical protein|nr:hypothetical protein [Deltaproteobacteria bacterium]MBT4090270.1 hypothetical protein [Deltaproteobacteria bacterium]MBT4268037.1 hypothetical protein [Deltaproteobacteria bacterium]MBT4641495.1 hypothetical protein [Deltaproteobacteria bacterium]MBT6503559.1 hypothetical protein [Deltaproteobacteria bacterium]